MTQKILLDQHYVPFEPSVTLGRSRECEVIHKFGHNPVTGTSYVPVAVGGVYQTPQVSGATTLRIAAGGDANDTAAGTGAREMTLEGLDVDGNVLVETLATNGISASSATSTAFLRLYRIYVSASGTYATSAAGSHTGAIVIENSAGGTTWATLESNDFPRGQGSIGAYSVATGFKALVVDTSIFTDTAKVSDVLFFKRDNILETAAPYTAMRVQFEVTSQGGATKLGSRIPRGPFVGPCDIGFMAKVDSVTADIDVDFEIWVFPDYG